MNTATALVSSDLDVRRKRVVGAAGFWAGLAGAAGGALLIFYPPQVPAEVFSYPLAGVEFAVFQLFLAVQHFVLVVLIAAVARTDAVGHSKMARGGLLAATASMAAFGVLEVVAITAMNTVMGGVWNTVIVTAYGFLSIAIGAALVVGGIGVLKHGAWSGSKRWLPLILGVYVFVPLLPSLMGPNVLGRVTISVWVLLFSWLGWVLWHTESRELQGARSIESERGRRS